MSSYWIVHSNCSGKGRDSEIAPTDGRLLVGGNSTSRLLLTPISLVWTVHYTDQIKLLEIQ